jgi:hypothetical protein
MVAVEASFACGPAPLCVEVAVAVWAPVVLDVVPVLPVLTGLAYAWPLRPKATAIAVAIKDFFILSPLF